MGSQEAGLAAFLFSLSKALGLPQEEHARYALSKTGDEINAAHGAAAGFGDRTAVPVVGDVSVPADAERMVRETIAQLGGLSVLVNNAGNVDRATVEDTGSIFLLNFTITGAPLRFQDGTWREYQDEQSSRSAWCVECVLLG